MEQMINNYINGNLDDAKRQAKRFKLMDIIKMLEYGYGYKSENATTIARYLKDQATWESACEAEAKNKLTQHEN